jgi:hypothetical protein
VSVLDTEEEDVILTMLDLLAPAPEPNSRRLEL